MAMDETTGFHTIVVGDDGSPAADAALRFAQRLAAEEAQLVLARVFAHEPDDHAATDLARRAPAGGDARVLRGHSVEHALCDLARTVDADLIVVGSDRRPGDYRARKVRGLRLVHGAPCAVAIAPTDAHEHEEIRRIGVAYDASPEAELALDAAYDLAARLHAAVSLYLAVLPGATLDLASQHARRDAGALLDAAAGRAPEGVNPETVILTGYASEAIARHAGHRVDLLVLGSRRQGRVAHAFLGSTSGAATVEVGCAVLITPRGAHVHVHALGTAGTTGIRRSPRPRAGSPG